jgi:hypothetical protein
MKTLAIAALAAVSVITASCGASAPVSNATSITGADFHGKKYFFAWAAPLDGELGNEVRFDVRHTSYIFTNQWGGAYQGTAYINPDQVKRASILAKLDDYATKLGPDDMYVQYSAGHGSPTGLEVGVTYDEIRAKVLAMKAKEIIVFTMSCYSGGVVADFKAQGRTLFIMSSSGKDELSSSGPILDDDEPLAADGSAGSAFGHAVWKALMGYADGYGGAAKDGQLTLGEIRDYVVAQTKKDGGHTPIVTGIYSDDLVMATLPAKLEARPEWTTAKATATAEETSLNAAEKALKAQDSASGADSLKAQLQAVTDAIAVAAPADLKTKKTTLDTEKATLMATPYPTVSGADSHGFPLADSYYVGPPGQTMDEGVLRCYQEVTNARFMVTPSTSSGTAYAPLLTAQPEYVVCKAESDLDAAILAAAPAALKAQHATLVDQLALIKTKEADIRQKRQDIGQQLETLVDKLLGYTPGALPPPT